MTEARPHIAPKGKIWVCMSCFKKAKARLDFLEWDEHSPCYDDAVLCDEVQPAPGFYAVTAAEPR